MSKSTQEHLLIKAIKNLTFVINTATQEIIYDIKKQKTHPTTHYIWRTRGDGKVRSRHAKFNGKIFSWDSPPAGGYHPGEDYGCRCIAEPYKPKVEVSQEKVSQIVTTPVNDTSSAWSESRFFAHYYFGGGTPVFLNEIGHLQNVIDHAQTYDQGGGSIFERVEGRIFTKARQNGAGSFPIKFNRSYKFGSLRWILGGVNLIGNGDVTVVEKGDNLIISANIKYYFNDTFRDAVDGPNWVPDKNPITGEPNYLEFPLATIYKIIGSWSTKIEAVIKKDKNESEFEGL